MENWQSKFLEVISHLEQEIDKQRYSLKDKLNLVSPATIQAYRGYGSEKGIFLRGRVIENEGLELPSKDASIWQNIKSLYHRYESDEIPHAKIKFGIDNLKETVTCNSEGFFSIAHSGEQITKGKDGKWQKLHLRILDSPSENQEEVDFEGEFQLQQPSNSFGIISDVDDTIIVTKATEFLEKIRIFILRNSHTRKPLEGIAAFYKALEAGKGKDCQNPIFYVSSSSWNLYDVFDQFCKINHIPKGTFLLQEMGISKDQFIRSGHNSHKVESISHVLETFTDLPFVLIGDSGQKDPEIYKEVAQKFPERIKAIYIRDVYPEKDEQRDQEVKEIAKQLEEKGIEMVLIQNSLEAAKHAVKLGLINEEAIPEIEKDMEEDKNRSADIAHLLGID